MKTYRIITVVLLGLLGGSTLFAQSETSAIRLGSQPNNFKGSARYQSLATSMGAVGADYSSVMINPAGLSFFRSAGKFSITGSLDKHISSASWYNQTNNINQSISPSFNELSYMSSWFKTAGVGFSFGFGIQKGASFDRQFDVIGATNGQGSSLADYVAASINKQLNNSGNIPPSEFTSNQAFQSYPWMWVLASRGGWIQSGDPQGHFYFTNFRVNPNNYSAGTSANLQMNEKGGITKYNFAASFDINNSFHIGLVANLTSFYYQLNSFYKENHLPDNNGQNEYLTLKNALTTKGAGISFGFGTIYEPIDGLRLGAAIYTPTYYSLTQDYLVDVSAVAAGYEHRAGSPDDGANAFSLNTPWRFTLSGAYIFGHKGFINVDYECTLLNSIALNVPRNSDYSDSNSGSQNNPYSIDNKAISEDFGARHSINIGAEYNVTHRFSVRGGIGFASSGISSSYLKTDRPGVEVLTDGTIPTYTLPNYFVTYSGGLGYKLTPKWSLDVALVSHVRTSRVYAFPVIQDPAPTWLDKSDPSYSPNPVNLEGYAPIKYSDNLISGVLTLSYRF